MYIKEMLKMKNKVLAVLLAGLIMGGAGTTAANACDVPQSQSSWNNLAIAQQQLKNANTGVDAYTMRDKSMKDLAVKCLNFTSKWQDNGWMLPNEAVEHIFAADGKYLVEHIKDGASLELSGVTNYQNIQAFNTVSINPKHINNPIMVFKLKVLDTSVAADFVYVDTVYCVDAVTGWIYLSNGHQGGELTYAFKPDGTFEGYIGTGANWRNF